MSDTSLDDHGHVEDLEGTTEQFSLGYLRARAALMALSLAFSQCRAWFLMRWATMASLTPCVLPAASHAVVIL